MDKKLTSFAELKDTILKEINKNIKKRKNESGFSRFEFRTEIVDPLLWLKAQPQKEKIFFESRGRGEPVVSVAGKIFESSWPDPEKSGLFGGISFFKAKDNGEEWEAFGASKFILPRFEYRIEDKKGFFAVNFRNEDINSKNRDILYSIIKELVVEPVEERSDQGNLKFNNFTPDREGWIKMITRYLARIKKGEVEKLVGARRLELDHEGNIDPYTILRALKKTGDYTANFLFSFNEEDYFIGATPERLFRREGDLLSAESVAGTSCRGSDKDEDEILGRDLLGSEKNSLEHDIVTEDIVNRIDPLCEMVAISERTLIKLSNLQHLYRKISGKVKKGVSDMELIDAMAPTPAVSGKPLKKSIDILKKEEPFQRGWYSGVVGFAGKNISDYYVAIRSVLLRKDKMFIYSGAGIVPGSDPEKEWEEIDLKIKKYKKILKYEI